jgi:predicted nucleic acid-binding Zn ribbon protein
MPPRQPVDPDRTCRNCTEPIPSDRNVRAFFCSRRCSSVSARRDYNRRNTDTVRASRYGTTAAWVAETREAQAWRCASCADPITQSSPLDHNHETGALRGILCVRCNVGIGMFQDDPHRLRRAAEYLERYLWDEHWAPQPDITSVVDVP